MQFKDGKGPSKFRILRALVRAAKRHEATNTTTFQKVKGSGTLEEKKDERPS